MAVALPLLFVLVLVFVGMVLFALRNAGVSVQRILGGFFLLAGTVLGIAALVQADSRRAPDGIAAAVLAAGALIAGALLFGIRSDDGRPGGGAGL